MRYLLTIVILLLTLSSVVKAQVNYAGKINIGYMKYLDNIVTVDPADNWKGYNLRKEQNGIDFNLINGLSFKNNKLFTGLGIGYMNFEGTNGVSVFADFEYLPMKTRMTPLLNLKLGYSHIWNQYEGGTGTILTEFGIGINYKVTEKFGLFLKTGILLTQQSSLIPIAIGLRF